MRRPGRMLVAAALAGWIACARAADAGTQAEIDHLLDFIAASPCTFVRNGRTSPPAEARAHVERKYRHVRRHAGTAEDFILYAATKSSVSGEPYRVICGDREMSSAAWLNEELARYRHGRSGTR